MKRKADPNHPVLFTLESEAWNLVLNFTEPDMPMPVSTPQTEKVCRHCGRGLSVYEEVDVQCNKCIVLRSMGLTEYLKTNIPPEHV